MTKHLKDGGRTKLVRIRLTPEQHEAMKHVPHLYGFDSVSEFTRAAWASYLKQPAQLAAALARINELEALAREMAEVLQGVCDTGALRGPYYTHTRARADNVLAHVKGLLEEER
jgi:hypothetical protein